MPRTENRDQERLVRLQEENERLRVQLEEAEQTLEAIRSGEVDALVIKGVAGEKVYSLEGAEKPYRIFFEQMSEGAATLAPDGMIIFSNPSLRDMLKTKESASGLNLISFAEGGMRQKLEDILRQAQVQPSSVEISFIANDGTIIPVDLSLNVLKIGESDFISLTALDLTERKRWEKELDESKEFLERRVEERTSDLARSNEELQQFAYVASHDLQEPLRMVVNYLSLLKRNYDGQLDSKAQEYIDYAMDGGQRMRELIEDLLTYSRIDVKGKPFASVDMQNVVARTLALLKVPIQDSKADIIIGPLPIIEADESQIMQVMQNLLSNAIKFRGLEKPLVVISAAQDSAEWTFAVKDNGIGLNPQYAERIFQMFQRLHSRQAYPGTGVGLAVARKIIERHGGRIWVKSEEGKGATFFFTIPFCRNEKEKAKISSPRS